VKAIAVAAWMIASAWIVPAYSQQQQQAPLPDYRLSPGDQLEISVWKEPDLTKTVVIRPDGKFTVPLAGEIAAAGRTLSQVQADIQTRLLKFIPEAVVTAALVVMEGNRVYVIGQVNKPGTFVMNPRYTVLQALSVAGGLTPFAGANDIIILRSAGGQQRVIPFKYGDVIKGRNLEQNMLLEAGDVVIVP
jgi:polysaccharide export outer membrane protein